MRSALAGRYARSLPAPCGREATGSPEDQAPTIPFAHRVVSRGTKGTLSPATRGAGRERA